MKVIVISGARSNIGKTGVALALHKLLPGSVYVKIGHGTRKPSVPGSFYHLGTSFKTIASQHGAAAFCIIESNSILREIDPDCTVFLPADNPKPSAKFAVNKADIIRGEPVTTEVIATLANRLDVPPVTITRMVTAIEESAL